jgi:hypothetical protein
MGNVSLRRAALLPEPSEPLWKRVPTRSEDGGLLSDFMMIIPGLRSKPEQLIVRTVNKIQQVFDSYHHAVVFADLNLRLNLLWVSVKPIPGICLELAAALKDSVPEAMLVAAKFDR